MTSNGAEAKIADLERGPPVDGDCEGPEIANFGVTPEELQSLFDPKDAEALRNLSGGFGICKALGVDPHVGLQEPPPDLEERVRVFGANRLPDTPSLSFLELMWLAAHDKTLIMLTLAALFSLAFGLYEDLTRDPEDPPIHWVEGTAIISTVIIVTLFSSLNDWQKERQFRKLNATKEARDVIVLRSGDHKTVSVYDVVVGDILFLEPGDVVPVDGILLELSNLRTDESAATGESDQIRKNLDGDPFVLSGSNVTDGTGKFVVCCVGERSYSGTTMMALRTDTGQTPLEVKLDGLAEDIAKLGAIAAFTMFVSVSVKYVVTTILSGRGFGPDCETQECSASVVQAFLEIFISAIAIVVVAVPEGLPLAVTLALAYGTMKMLRDNNLVRVLSACETMGGATCILSDKTGTLTQNRMTVTRGILGRDRSFAGDSDIAKLLGDDPRAGSGEPISTTGAADSWTPLDLVLLLQESVSLNSSAFSRPDPEDSSARQVVGSKTETALLDFCTKIGGPNSDWERVRTAPWVTVVHVYPFSSLSKCMATVVKISAGDAGIDNGFYRVYVKGASEIVLDYCSTMPSFPPDPRGRAVLGDITKGLQEEIKTNVIDRYAGEALRTICLAYRDISASDFDRLTSGRLRDVAKAGHGDSEPDLEAILNTSPAFEEFVHSKKFTMLGIVGIADPLRDGVADAVALCKKAGVSVRMVTGDNPLTAKSIAVSCGIYEEGVGIAMEGKDFRLKAEAGEADDLLPKLQVLSRSSPRDKQLLVSMLQKRGETVAVTGDGTNDAPALKMADVGFSMGLSGTEVAKEASAIVLMDDNFASIVRAMMWGRAINDAVKKFLQFQLTVNITATLLAFVSSLADGNEQSVLTAVQLLWVNAIMDTLAGLALATEEPTLEILDRPPQGKDSALITENMWKMIFVQATLQITVFLVLLFYGPWMLGCYLAAAGGITHDLDTVQPPPGFPGTQPEFSQLCWDQKRQLRSVIFNAFIFMQLSNELNCRRLDNKLNVFANLRHNLAFVYVTVFVLCVQLIIMFFGGAVFRVTRLSEFEWAVSVGLGLLSLPAGVLARLVPNDVIFFWKPVSRRNGRVTNGSSGDIFRCFSIRGVSAV
ncbi:PMCA-type calcium-translocating P-type ATPase [Hyaloraphidium curvatum]|nr:PMCA-type calcium-translocating P-type ATPase [Hyaloraphidium curvatum]